MAKPVSNVVIATDTFAGLVGKTNILADALTNLTVTVENSTAGANVSGNGSVLGILAANTFAGNVFRGGGVGNTANVSTLTLGLANSTVSSNVIVTGYTANVTANNLNITSNSTVNAAALTVNVATIGIYGNTTLGSNSSHNTTLNGNTLTVTSNTTVNAAAFTLNVATISVYGNTTIGSNTTHNFTAVGNVGSVTMVQLNIPSNTYINAPNVSVNAANVTVSGGQVNLTSNLNVSAAYGIITGNVFVGNAVATPVIRGGNVESGSTLTIGSSTSNVTVVGLTSNVNSNTLNITSNSYINAANVTVNTALFTVNTSSFYTINAGDTVRVSNSMVISNGSLTVNNSVSIYSNSSTRITTSAIGSVLTFPNATTQNTVDSFLLTDFTAAKYTVTAIDTSNTSSKTMSELSVVHGAGNAHMTEYGTIFVSNQFATYTIDANTTHVRLFANSTVGSVAFKLLRVAIT